MVKVTIRVRPRQAYHYPNKIDQIEIDSSQRLESIQEKYSSSSSTSTTRLYYGQHELPLNSSIGSHNFDDFTILECCRSPAIAAALSACLKDLDEVRKLQHRTRENLMKVIQTPSHIRNNASHDIWKEDSWKEDNVKSRTINFAIMKAVVQRQDRYQVHDLPHCSDCRSLFHAMRDHKVWDGGNGGGNLGAKTFRQQSHLFKPEKNDGSPSTNWILLEEKLNIQQQIRNEFATISNASPAEDYLEEFVRRDHARHNHGMNGSDRETSCASSSSAMPYTDPDSYLVHLASPSPVQQRQRKKQHHSASSSIDIGDGSPATNYASKSPIRTSSKQPQEYTPEYASGPFAVLSTLYLAMHGEHPKQSISQSRDSRRLLTMTELQLKRFAQPNCRSNLYDKGRIRGRSAFVCMDDLIKKDLVRKEIVRNTASDSGEIEKWGLLPKGEVLGKYCAEFQRAVDNVIPVLEHHKPNTGNELVLCFDNREDVHFLQRLRWSCEDENVNFVERELPAGDYLFLCRRDGVENVLPLVIERKTWSDLADSCLGKGRALNRLDCVKLGSDYTCRGNCQLCKMKRCGCSRVMFIIEGERCLGRDSVHRESKRCSPSNCCSACKQLSERHNNLTQAALEDVLTRLQIDHECLIHYTRSYNETVQSLLTMRSLLQHNLQWKTSTSKFLEPSLSFESYASNARSSKSNEVQSAISWGEVKEESVEKLVATISGGEWNSDIVKRIFGSDVCGLNVNSMSNVKPPAVAIKQGRSESTPIQKCSPARSSKSNNQLGSCSKPLFLDSESEDDDVIEIVQENSNSSSRPCKRRKYFKDAICLDSDSDNESGLQVKPAGIKNRESPHKNADVEVIDGPVTNISKSNSEDDEIVILDFDEPSVAKQTIAKLPGDALICPGREIQLPILILLGWDEYDKKFQQKLNDVWKKEAPSRCVVGSIDGIHAEWTTCLKNISNQGFPCMRRQSMMEFMLWIQIIVGVHVRPVQRKEFAERIKGRLNKDGNLYTQKVPNASVTPHLSTLPSDSECCLSAPSCGLQKSNENIVVPTERKLPSSSASNETITAREARIRRFDASGASPSNLNDLSGDCLLETQFSTWSCSSCTLENSSSETNCTACTAPRMITGGAVECESTPDWTCSNCTLRNSLDLEVCSACGSRVPCGTSSENWTCSFCSKTNPTDRLKCLLCGTSCDKGLTFRPLHAPSVASLPTYQQSVDEQNTGIHASATWICPRCTHRNSFDSKKCLCGRSRMWHCKSCARENPISQSHCFFCDPNHEMGQVHHRATSSTTPRKSPLRYPDTHTSTKVSAETPYSGSQPSSAKKSTKCGACGKEGHNRGNATEFTCPAYFVEKEIERRHAMERKKKEAIAREKEKIERLEQEGNNAQRLHENLLRQTKELMENFARTEEYRKEEEKRARQKKKRLEKRQNRT